MNVTALLTLISETTKQAAVLLHFCIIHFIPFVALLAHQKARFGLIKRRVEETKIKTDAMRKEVADMEKDLDRRRAQTPASSFASVSTFFDIVKLM